MNNEDMVKYLMNDGFIKPELTIDYPLYRYRSNMEYILDEIENERIYLATFDQLNDPFDSSYALSFEKAKTEKRSVGLCVLECTFLLGYSWHQAAVEQLSSYSDQKLTLEEFSELFSERIENVGGHYPAKAIAKNIYEFSWGITRRIGYGRVASFSEVWDSIPMWSYYANSHKGVCIKYNFNLLNKEDITNKNILQSLQKVWYSDNRPIDDKALYSPFVKGIDWAHEREWRLFRDFGSEYVSLPCIAEIYLGIQFDLAQAELLLDAVCKLKKDINIYILSPAQNRYGLTKKLLYGKEK